MKDRLLRFMTHNRLTASRFADEIGVQRSGISHILSGRNQPSYDFIVKIMKRYPEISLDWLILGSGQMLKGTGEDADSVSSGFITQEKMHVDPADPEEFRDPENNHENKKITNVTSIDQIVIFFADRSFKPYFPSSEG